jgi:hypothetical protein
MDMQILFNIAVGIAAFFGGWILNRIYTAIDRLDNDVRNLPKDYVSKDDYRIDIQDMNKKLDKIFDLLQTKVDKA